jgi:Reverse transcriptase (RNA-dependent DNA polymerase)
LKDAMNLNNLAFIDYEKALVSVYTASVLSALRNRGIDEAYRGIDEAYIELIQNVYINATSTLRLHKNSEQIHTREVRQGDTISPKLLNTLLEEVFNTLEYENAGISINGDYLSNLRFADDIFGVASSLDELKK